MFFLINVNLFSYLCCLLQEILNNLRLQSRIKESTQGESQQNFIRPLKGITQILIHGIFKIQVIKTRKLIVNPKGDPLRLAKSLNVNDEFRHCLLAEFDKMVDLLRGVLRAYDQICLFQLIGKVFEGIISQDFHVWYLSLRSL